MVTTGHFYFGWTHAIGEVVKDREVRQHHEFMAHLFFKARPSCRWIALCLYGWFVIFVFRDCLVGAHYAQKTNDAREEK